VKRHWILVVTFAAGLIVGVVVGFVLVETRAPNSPTYVLQSDLNLTKTFFFDDRPAPVRGTIAAGSEFQVEFRYSNADYIAFRTVVERDELMRISKVRSASEKR
jgi:hypothetical protein